MSAINAIYNANVYIDGNSLLGNASEFKLPEFEFGQDDHTGLGMVGTIKLPNGVEALEGVQPIQVRTTDGARQPADLQCVRFGGRSPHRNHGNGSVFQKRPGRLQAEGKGGI